MKEQTHVFVRERGEGNGSRARSRERSEQSKLRERLKDLKRGERWCKIASRQNLHTLETKPLAHDLEL
jgi:hypothetical protein